MTGPAHSDTGARPDPNDDGAPAHPTGGDPTWDRSADDRPAWDQSAGDRPADDRPAWDRTAGDRPADDRQAWDGSADDRPADDRSAWDRSAGDRPADDRSADELWPLSPAALGLPAPNGDRPHEPHEPHHAAGAHRAGGDGGPLHAHDGEDTRPAWAARALGMPDGPAEGVLGAFVEAPAGDVAELPAGPPPRPRVPIGVALATEARMAVTLLVAGLGVDVLWRAIAPDVARGGNPLEAAASVDGTLALLGAVTGLVTGVLLLTWPGPRPLARTSVALAASLVAASFPWWLTGTSGRAAAALAAVAGLAAAVLLRRGGAPRGRVATVAGAGLVIGVALWLLVESLGDSPLRSPVTVLVWPLFTSGVLFVGAMFPALSRRLDPPLPPTPFPHPATDPDPTPSADAPPRPTD